MPTRLRVERGPPIVVSEKAAGLALATPRESEATTLSFKVGAIP